MNSLRKETVWFLVMAGPAIVGFLCLTLGPMAYSLYLSLCKYTVVEPPQFIGFCANRGTGQFSAAIGGEFHYDHHHRYDHDSHLSLRRLSVHRDEHHLQHSLPLAALGAIPRQQSATCQQNLHAPHAGE